MNCRTRITLLSSSFLVAGRRWPVRSGRQRVRLRAPAQRGSGRKVAPGALSRPEARQQGALRQRWVSSLRPALSGTSHAFVIEEGSTRALSPVFRGACYASNVDSSARLPRAAFNLVRRICTFVSELFILRHGCLWLPPCAAGPLRVARPAFHLCLTVITRTVAAPFRKDACALPFRGACVQPTVALYTARLLA